MPSPVRRAWAVVPAGLGLGVGDGVGEGLGEGDGSVVGEGDGSLVGEGVGADELPEQLLRAAMSTTRSKPRWRMRGR
ncbi:MAG: hypothetical protein QOE99_525 [Actinomycetota bacterium]|jgi:hypothetical protein|nr:hypothetical protein [Actinomycetota bacterium]